MGEVAGVAAGVALIMARRPGGAVKTRLYPQLSPQQANSLYQAFLADTIMLVDRACRMGANLTPGLAYTPADAADYFRALLPHRFVLLPQQGADLGARLGNLPLQARALGYSYTAMIDSDSPTLPAAYVAQAFRELARPEVDFALGPCRDGGYYLIGLKQPQPALFENIVWSSASVTADTLRQAAQAGLRAALLPTWYDVDTAVDLDTLRAELNECCDVAPATRAYLAATGLYPSQRKVKEG